MKKLMSSMLAIAAMASMISCSTEDILDEGGQIDNGPVEIKLNAGVNEITTKAAIKPGDAFTAQVVAIKNDGTYADAPLWGNDTKGNIEVAETSGDVTFKTAQYYPADGSIIKMKGFAPQETNIANGIVSYTITGAEDIMVSDEITASKTDKTDKILAFKHLLTQLQIEVVAADEGAATAWGTITDITINAATKLDLDLSAGTIGANASTPINADLKLEGFQEHTLTFTADAAAKQVGTVMVLPSTTAYKLKITTDTKTTPQEITITPATTEASKAHVITLTFKGTQILATATAGEWTSGASGAGTVE